MIDLVGFSMVSDTVLGTTSLLRELRTVLDVWLSSSIRPIYTSERNKQKIAVLDCEKIVQPKERRANYEENLFC